MKKVPILLNSVDRVKDFVTEISKLPCDCDILSGSYAIDAKSIMGIFSLNLSRPVYLVIHDGNMDTSGIDKYTVGNYVQI